MGPDETGQNTQQLNASLTPELIQEMHILLQQLGPLAQSTPQRPNFRGARSPFHPTTGELLPEGFIFSDDDALVEAFPTDLESLGEIVGGVVPGLGDAAGAFIGNTLKQASDGQKFSLPEALGAGSAASIPFVPGMLGKAATKGQKAYREARKARRFVLGTDIKTYETMFPPGKVINQIGSEPLGGTVIKKTDLPDKLFHVTTNADKVDEAGILRSFHDEASPVKGLGKGSSKVHQGISLTNDQNTAIAIKRDLVRTGEVARSGGGSNRVAIMTQIAREDEALAGVAPGALQPALDDALRSGDPWNQYLFSRERVTGIENPIIFGMDDELAKIVPEQVRIIEVKPSQIPEGALIRENPLETGHLNEVMVHSDIRIPQGQGKRIRASEPIRNKLKGTKVLDEGSVNPKRVFHGTPKEFGDLDIRKADSEALYGPGFYFTDNPKIAGGDSPATLRDLGYSSPRPELSMDEVVFTTDSISEANRFTVDNPGTVMGKDPLGGSGFVVTKQVTQAPNVRPAFLDIKNPFDIDGSTRLTNEAVDRVRNAAKLDGPQTDIFNRYVENEIAMLGDDATEGSLYSALEAVLERHEITKVLQRAGFDGITHIGGGDGGLQHRVWIAFTPEQVVPAFAPGAPTTFRTRTGGN